MTRFSCKDTVAFCQKVALACDNSIRQSSCFHKHPLCCQHGGCCSFAWEHAAAAAAQPLKELKGNIGTKHCCGWHCSICTNKEQTAGASKSCIPLPEELGTCSCTLKASARPVHPIRHFPCPGQLVLAQHSPIHTRSPFPGQLSLSRCPKCSHTYTGYAYQTIIHQLQH